MMKNALEKFSDELFQFLIRETPSGKGLLVKKHSENLQSAGDFSFPNSVKSWHGLLKCEQSDESDNNLMKHIGKDIADLINESKTWVFQVKNAKEIKDRVHVFLERPIAIHVGLMESLINNELISNKILEGASLVSCDPLCEDNNITSLRLRYLSKTIQNLYAINTTSKEKAPNVFISAKSSSSGHNSRTILCGVVLNAKTGAKETSLRADDFIRIRQDEMTLIAQHKYGVRVSTDTKWKEFIAHLGQSAVIFELLQIKPSSAVKINFDCGSAGSSKGAAFVLYNCARLETIVRTFKEKVDDGTYPPLPDFESTEFSLLKHEEEWNLVFNFVLGLPTLLDNSVEINERACEFRPHHVCNFLCAMVRVFSQYYRKVRILTEPRKHLLPVMFARIHMLKILNSTLKLCLNILNIKSVSQM